MICVYYRETYYEYQLSVIHDDKHTDNVFNNVSFVYHHWIPQFRPIIFSETTNQNMNLKVDEANIIDKWQKGIE